MTNRASRFVLAAIVLVSVVIGLGCSQKPDVSEEIRLREEYAALEAKRAGATEAYRLQSTSEVIFADGFSNIEFDPPGDFRNHAFRYIGQGAHARLRSHGDKPMFLHIFGWLNRKLMQTRPFVSATIDGQYIGQQMQIGDDGLFWIDAVLSPQMLKHSDWVDLHIVLSSVQFYALEVPALKIGVLLDLVWSEKIP
ncbi:MAG: hypothetical protein FWD73_17730 [Polyangiaceae bacterium]|nr:hypothetical protein [Polyangiaceae bacterium]